MLNLKPSHLLAVDLAEELALALHEAALPLAGQALPAGSQLGRDGSALRRERERLHDDDDEREEHARSAPRCSPVAHFLQTAVFERQFLKIC